MAKRRLVGLGLPLKTRMRLSRAVIDRIQPHVDEIAARELGVGRIPGRPPIRSEYDPVSGKASWTIPQQLAEQVWEQTVDDYVDWGAVLFALSESFEGSVGVRLHRGEEDRLKGGLGLSDILARAIKRAGGGGPTPREGI